MATVSDFGNAQLRYKNGDRTSLSWAATTAAQAGQIGTQPVNFVYWGNQYYFELEAGAYKGFLIDTNPPAVNYWRFTGNCP